jgi:hypothetical protein
MQGDIEFLRADDTVATEYDLEQHRRTDSPITFPMRVFILPDTSTSPNKVDGPAAGH